MERSIKKFTELLDEHLEDEKFAAAFFSQSLEENFSAFLSTFRQAIRAYGNCGKIAKDAKVSRVTIYKIFSDNLNSRLTTILLILDALGYNIVLSKRPKKK